MDQYKIMTDCGQGLFPERLSGLYKEVKAYIADEEQAGRTLRYTKIFLSDIANQDEALRESPLMTDIVAKADYTIIQQSPIGGAKIGLLMKTDDEPDAFTLDSLRLQDDEVMNFGSYTQTVMLFEKYLGLLKERGMTLKDHCLRTWIYVRDIDTNYDGVVKARNDIFRQHGLTVDTHFIASTGIGGRAVGKNVCVAIDFLTAVDAEPADRLYLKALDHLNPTHEYGVAFERGTRITLPHRYEYFISGTASIDCHGEVVHTGNISRQTGRLLENIGARLSDGGATMADVRYFIIYLRDLADATVVDDYMAHFYPDVPRIITHAKVCRPAWLVEMECIAEKER